MITYNNKVLNFKDGKKAGKNRSPVDGFYIDEEGVEYFIKKPADKKELFTELLAGFLLKEFISRGLIEPRYVSSLIHADLIRFEDGSYGLIQPKVSFTELYKIIETGNGEGTDRDPFLEMRDGPNRYPALTQQGPHFGLSTALMFSWIFGDHSVHSGNVVILKLQIKAALFILQFARIDWGASFRYFAHPDNNRENLFDFYQYQGWFNIKRFTQGYFNNYKNISGLFSAMGIKAEELRLAMDRANISMQEIVASAFGKIPEDLLDPETQAQLAEYMAIPSFATTKFGAEGDYQEITGVFSSVLTERLTKISTITETNNHPIYAEADENNLMYQSFRALDSSTPVIINTSFNLPEQFELLIKTVKTGVNLDFSETDLSVLARQFNRYVKHLAVSAERGNLWNHSFNVDGNLFANYLPDKELTTLGPAIRESALLKGLYTLDPITLKTRGDFAAYESAIQAYSRQDENKNSAWLPIENTLMLGLHIIKKLERLKKIQSSSDKDTNSPEVMKAMIAQLQEDLPLFLKSQEYVNELFQKSSTTIDSNVAFKSHSFYFFSKEKLDKMDGSLLLTICFEELYFAEPSSLVARIISDDLLWERIKVAYSPEISKNRDKFEKLEQWRHPLTIFLAHKKQFDEAATLADKEKELTGLQRSFQEIPSFLKAETQLIEELLNRETLLIYWQKEQTFLSTKTADAHVDLAAAFATLPSPLKHECEYKFTNYQKERDFLQQKESHLQDTDLDLARTSFNRLKEFFIALPPEIKLAYQNELNSLEKRMDDWQAHQDYIAQEKLFLRSELGIKREAYQNLKRFFNQLPDKLQANFKRTMDEYSSENDYLEQREIFQKSEIVELRITNFYVLKNLFDKLSQTLKLSYHEDFVAQWEKTLCYEQILKVEIAKDTDSTLLIDETLDRLNTGQPDAELFINAVITDKKLWVAVINHPNKEFTPGLIQDLLAIQKFYKQRALPENDIAFGVEYNESLSRFYERTLNIRLSPKPIKEQAQEIYDLAHEEFIPRHKTQRKLTDAFMLISILFFGLGAVIMLGRYCSHKPTFFSQAITDREQALRGLIKADLSNEDTNLFNAVVAPAA